MSIGFVQGFFRLLIRSRQLRASSIPSFVTTGTAGIDTFHQMEHPAYDAVARTLHWITVLLITMQFVIGRTMPDIHRDTQPVGLIAWHLGVGSTLIAIMAIRVIWRLTHWPTPDELSPLLSVVSRLT